MIRLCFALAAAALLGGCTSPRVSRYDEYEKVKVDKMVGNDVRFHFLSKTVICLNGMRETRWPRPVTNVVVTLQTNLNVTSVTNVTITTSANQQLAGNTNLTVVPAPPGESAADSILDATTNSTVFVVGNTPADSTGGGLSVSTTRNESIVNSPNQNVVSRTFQKVTMVNLQATVNSTNQSVTGGTNLLTTVETNYLITTLTNQMVAPITNVTVISLDRPLYDYYLYTEIAPADFSLLSGESLVVLIDGERHSFAPTQPVSSQDSRRGFLTTFYRVSPEVLADLANAREVKMRLKSATGGLERTLSSSCRQQFRTFLKDHFDQQKQTADTDQSKKNQS